MVGPAEEPSMKLAKTIALAGAGLLLAGTAFASDADKADLTPKLKAGDKFTFKQRTVRKDTMYLGNLNIPKMDAPKVDAPAAPAAPATPKLDTPKPEVPRGEAPKDAMMSAALQPTAPAKPAMPALPGPDEKPASSTTSVDQTATFELRVTEASETGASLELEFKSIQCTAELSQGKFSWDST